MTPLRMSSPALHPRILNLSSSRHFLTRLNSSYALSPSGGFEHWKRIAES